MIYSSSFSYRSIVCTLNITKILLFLGVQARGGKEQQVARHAQGEVRRPRGLGHRKVRRPTELGHREVRRPRGLGNRKVHRPTELGHREVRRPRGLSHRN